MVDYATAVRRQWHLTPVLLPGKSHGRRSLVGCSLQGHKGSDVTEQHHFHFSLLCTGEGNGNPLQFFCLENRKERVAWSWTRLKWLRSSSSSVLLLNTFCLRSDGNFPLTNNLMWGSVYFLPTASVQFSHSVVSYSLRPHGLQNARPPCPSPTPSVYSNSCPSSQWCHPSISSSVVPFSSRLQSFPASGSLQMSQLFASGGQSIGVSASASVFQRIFNDFLLDGLVGSPCSPRDSQESSPTPQFKSINSSVLSFLYRYLLHLLHSFI